MRPAHSVLSASLALFAALACPVQVADAQTTSATTTTQDSTATADPIDKEAIAALQKMGTYLHTLKQFTVHADSTIDLITVDDQKLQFPGTIDYKVRVPNGLQMDVNTPRKHRQLFFDGKTMTIWSPETKFYASVDAPGTIRDMLARAEDRYAIRLPMADLFLWGTDKAPISDIQSAMVVGASTIEGVACTQYAFRQPDVDWQVWIQDGEKPLPRRLVLTTTDDPTEPQYATTLGWNTDAKLADSDFAFVPGEQSVRIGLAEANAAANTEATP